ncbi:MULTISPECIES: RNA polymerase sigma factor [Butyricimonas]|uniref:RNA polymerase sigma factor n=1 Tax=Butyricimonas TaxID=574697 RepID=UPI001D085246|nr:MULTISPECIES: sigma-70 family RNA polymerase sigma factor [Butyricimonas]MCB6971581.1 sigma-70 family RNA polymerase sigma factor [Butyricimonas synergistica]MCG4518811.1 sigma-70 family RNA polymerase sigma factor [Butyricimonas sp. DFI.6.44]
MVSDRQIIELLKAGKREGMGVLFDRYYKPLVVFADGLLHDLSAAEDVVQEQLVKLWEEALYERIHERALSTFLFTMVKNTCTNQLLRRGIKTELLALPHYQIAQEEAHELDPEVIRVVRKALDTLPEKTRGVVECVMLRGRMYKEAAEELGVSVNTVKTLLKVGLKELRILLKEQREMIFLFISRLNKVFSR